MEMLSYYRYEAWDTPVVRRIRIPQHEWASGEFLVFFVKQKGAPITVPAK